MLPYIAKRVLLAFFAVWVISMLSWVIIQLPEGDAVDTYFWLSKSAGILRAQRGAYGGDAEVPRPR